MGGAVSILCVFRNTPLRTSAASILDQFAGAFGDRWLVLALAPTRSSSAGGDQADKGDEGVSGPCVLYCLGGVCVGVLQSQCVQSVFVHCSNVAAFSDFGFCCRRTDDVHS